MFVFVSGMHMVQFDIFRVFVRGVGCTNEKDSIILC